MAYAVVKKLTGLDVYVGREAPGGPGTVDFATDENSLWLWAFGWEVIVSRAKRQHA